MELNGSEEILDSQHQCEYTWSMRKGGPIQEKMDLRCRMALYLELCTVWTCGRDQRRFADQGVWMRRTVVL